MPVLKGNYTFEFDEESFRQECIAEIKRLLQKNDEATSSVCAALGHLDQQHGEYIKSIKTFMGTYERVCSQNVMSMDPLKFNHLVSFTDFIEDEYKREYSLTYRIVEREKIF